MSIMNFVKLLNTVRDLDSDDMLERLGLERRSSGLERVLTTLGIFGAGIVVGAGVGMLFSPVAAEDMRRKITEGASRVKDEITGLVQGATDEIPKIAGGGPGRNEVRAKNINPS